MSSEKVPSGRRPPASAADAAQRLATIVDAAERAAAGVIDDAERQARRMLDEARERADRIVAERLRELADSLDAGTAPTVPAADGNGQGEEAVEERPRPLLKPVADEPPAGRLSSSAGARLLATQMAVSGASRAEIEERLRIGFEIDDTSQILDAILGSED